MTTASALADRLIAGGDPATAEELVDLLKNAPREELREAAHRVTVAFAPKHFDFCSIVNARSGRCPENCKWCAQSAHWKTGCECHGWIGAEACAKAAKEAEANGADRIGIVTSGRAQTPADVDALCEALRAMRREMHGFYSTLKNNVGVIRFLMMTGVSKFTKLSVFSGLNNLTDLTIENPQYAALLGYTRKEMETYFHRHIAAMARKMKCDYKTAFKSLLFWYDSYRFSPFSTKRVLNPVAVGKAIPSGILINYWSKTGMPTLILERLQACDKRPDNIDGVTATLDDLDVCDAEDLPWVSLLYQSGYLTIKGVEWYHPANDPARHPRMTLGVPNMEVRESLKALWWKQLMKIEERDFTALVDVAKRQLAEGDVRMLVGKTLYSLYASLPPTWRVKSEADAKRHFQLFMKMLGANVLAEEASVFGYADAIVETRKAVYVFEFKFNRSAKAAVRQIREKGYADAYKGGKRPVTLVGINFSARKRNIDEPLIESL